MARRHQRIVDVELNALNCHPISELLDETAEKPVVHLKGEFVPTVPIPDQTRQAFFNQLRPVMG